MPKLGRVKYYAGMGNEAMVWYQGTELQTGKGAASKGK